MNSFDGESGARWSFDTSARIGDKGGFGEVFRGACSDGRAVAVKRVTLREDRESERRRREREVEIGQLLAATSANHVMRLLDVGRVGTDLLLVMPLADRSLAAAIKAGDLDDVARVEVLSQVAQGLAELAEIAVLHRDLKPANVLDFQGLWKLADFGIARNLLESTDTYTFLGAGTPYYMAPELWERRPATVKSDLYAFGVLAFEVLTGTRPFTAADEQTLQRQHMLEPPPPLPSSVPSTIGRLVLRMLAKDPAARPQDARAVVEILEAALRRLSTQQEALREGAFAAQRRFINVEAIFAGEAARREARKQQTAQAIGDLHEIVEEAADQAKEALPEVEFRHHGVRWDLRWDRIGLAITVWPQGLSPEAPNDDPLIVAGEVTKLINGLAQGPFANIVCEPQQGRLRWSLLRFTLYKRVVGLEWDLFSRERTNMLRGDSWNNVQMRTTPLTSGAMVDLLSEAMDDS